MKPKFVLLLTRDSAFRDLLAQTLAPYGTILLVAKDVGDALQLICSQGHSLDFVVIDYAGGCHGMTMLAAIKACHPETPVLAVASNDAYRIVAAAYANGVTACLAKPITASELAMVIAELAQPKLELQLA